MSVSGFTSCVAEHDAEQTEAEKILEELDCKLCGVFVLTRLHLFEQSRRLCKNRCEWNPRPLNLAQPHL